MQAQFTPYLPGEASARPKYTPVNLTRGQTRKRNSFPGPESNRFIDAMIKQLREEAIND